MRSARAGAAGAGLLDIYGWVGVRGKDGEKGGVGQGGGGGGGGKGRDPHERPHERVSGGSARRAGRPADRAAAAGAGARGSGGDYGGASIAIVALQGSDLTVDASTVLGAKGGNGGVGGTGQWGGFGGARRPRWTRSLTDTSPGCDGGLGGDGGRGAMPAAVTAATRSASAPWAPPWPSWRRRRSRPDKPAREGPAAMHPRKTRTARGTMGLRGSGTGSMSKIRNRLDEPPCAGSARQETFMRKSTAATFVLLLSPWATGCGTASGVNDPGVTPCEGTSCEDEPPPESVCIEHVAADILDDGCGVFLAGNVGGGDDRNPGTKAKPVYTVERAIELARTGRGRVFLCNEGFIPSQFRVPSGVDLLGGFHCLKWVRDSAAPVDPVQSRDGRRPW